jgi:hypothetical protein
MWLGGLCFRTQTSPPAGSLGKRIFFEEWTNEHGRERVKFPATECPRIIPEFLEGERRSLGEWWFRQEYLCEFMESVDAAFRTEDIQRMFKEEVQQLEM